MATENEQDNPFEREESKEGQIVQETHKGLPLMPVKSRLSSQQPDETINISLKLVGRYVPPPKKKKPSQQDFSAEADDDLDFLDDILDC